MMTISQDRPELWSTQDVQGWIMRCNHDYSLNLTQQHVDNFSMNGKALLKLTREDFCQMVPGAGDVIYNVLRHLAETIQRSPLASPALSPHTLMGNTTDIRHTPWACDTPRHQGALVATPYSPGESLVRYHLLHNTRDITHTAPSQLTRLLGDVTRIEENPDVRPPPCDNTASNSAVPSPVSMATPTPYSPGVSSSSSVNTEDTCNELPPCITMETTPGQGTISPSVCSRKKHISNMYTVDTACLPPKKRRMRESVTSEPELSRDHITCSPGIPESPDDEADNKTDCQNSNNKLLWEYISELLQKPRRERPVRWLDETSLTFRITDPAGLAELWGQQKQKENMTYEKLSRALRYYYPMNIICKVHGRKLTYRFTTPPTKIKKGIRGAKPGVPHKRRKLDPNKTPSDGKHARQESGKKVGKTATVACMTTPEEPGVLDLSTKPANLRQESRCTPDSASSVSDCPPTSTSSSDSGIEIDIPISDTADAGTDSSPQFSDDPFSCESADTGSASSSVECLQSPECLDLRCSVRQNDTRTPSSASQSPSLTTDRSPTLNNLNRFESYSRTALREADHEMTSYLRYEHNSAFTVVGRTINHPIHSVKHYQNPLDTREDLTIFAL